MSVKTLASLFLVASLSSSFGCTADVGQIKGTGIGTPAPAVQAGPAKNFTEADISKLKWIEGDWRGMDGDKPFYERYSFERTAMVVEGFPDGTFSKATDSDRFELKDGEFGKGAGDERSAASAIGDGFVQFVPAVPGKGNNFRFERQGDGTWNAILEWPAVGDKPATRKIYHMERWPKK